jgi:16S rRNA (uracil1498-N3)-methyltransferase
MPAERYFSPEAFHLHRPLILTDKEGHHLAHVMRSQVGDCVEVVNGQGTLAIATIIEIKKDRVTLKISQVEQQDPPTPEVILAQAIPRLNRLDLILEKGTELGVTQIWLFPAELSERKEINAHQMGRLEAILIAAMKQCGRLWLPRLILKEGLSTWQRPHGALFFGDVDPLSPPFTKVWIPSTADLLFFIGPEKGFTEREEKMLKTWEAKGVKLAPHILRTDTAAMAALTLICHGLLEQN